MFYKAGPLFLVTILLAVVSLSTAGCTNKEDTVNKLDGTLNQLIRAEEKGEAEEFARQRAIELLDGSVRVMIECLAGHAEEVARAAGAFGIVEGTARDVVQVVVPITNLNALDELEGIRFIRMPKYPEEEAE
jgi:hypothetical protein